MRECEVAQGTTRLKSVLWTPAPDEWPMASRPVDHFAPEL